MSYSIENEVQHKNEKERYSSSLKDIISRGVMRGEECTKTTTSPSIFGELEGCHPDNAKILNPYI